MEKTYFLLGETNFIQYSQKKSLTGWFQGLIFISTLDNEPFKVIIAINLSPVNSIRNFNSTYYIIIKDTFHFEALP